MTYTIKEHVKVDLRANGVDYSLDLKAGEHDLEPAVAELLIAQGLVTAKVKNAKPGTTPTPSIESPEE